MKIKSGVKNSILVSILVWLMYALYANCSSCRADGIGWLAVRGPASLHQSAEECDPDVLGLQQSWDELKASGRTVNYQSIKEIAMMHHVKAGKWFFHLSSGLKVDHLWSVVAKGVVQGKLGGSAKVSPFDPHEEEYKHVLLIYNDDFTNHEQVLDLENRIRAIGIKAQLIYKPDVYTYIGIYRNNVWGLRPTIYRSDFDVLAGHSKVVSYYDNY